jgi:hypothetical protein
MGVALHVIGWQVMQLLYNAKLADFSCWSWNAQSETLAGILLHIELLFCHHWMLGRATHSNNRKQRKPVTKKRLLESRHGGKFRSRLSHFAAISKKEHSEYLEWDA